jgi:membrane peptidoglycan carboxypeptidase
VTHEGTSDDPSDRPRPWPGAAGQRPQGPPPGYPPAGPHPSASPHRGDGAGYPQRWAGEAGGSHGDDPYQPGYGEPAGSGYGGSRADPDRVAAARRALAGGGSGEPPSAPPPGAPPPGGRRPGDRPKRRRRRWRRIVLAAMAGFLVLLVGLAAALYVGVKVPLPNQLATSQISTITFADGALMARVGAQNRTDVPLAKVPEHVRWAVIAAENRTFYTDPGISARGILRATLNNLHGGELQGGSGITQQYVKNAYLTQEKTLSRKFKELAIAVKVDRQHSKDQILEWYLNTIYFGRGAYGIQAAAQTYFGKDVGKLSVAEGAVLAASIRSPALYDPQGHPEAAKSRWKFVVDGMVEMGKLAQAAVDRTRYPAVRPRSSGGQPQLNGPIGLIMQQVKDELARNGFDEAALNAKGLRVVTTIDRSAQAAAATAVRQVFTGQPGGLRQALVAVEPATGKVLAYWGGARGNGFDYAQAWRPPGSSFKPLTLATALQQTVHPAGDARPGPVSVYKTYDGSSPRQFPGSPPIRNSGGAQCPKCTVLEAMKRSINTVFYDMAIQVGPRNVADLAHKMGVPLRQTNNGRPTLQKGGVTDGSIGIGRYEVRTVDQAVAFGVFAANGQLHPPYFVQKVLDGAGNVLYEHKAAPRQVLDPRVANDVTYALKPVASWSHDGLAGDRESASKTGTQQFGETEDNSDAWMVGFTQQVSAAVWVGQDRPGPIRTAAGRPIYGAGLPGQTWQAFLDAWLAGKPALQLTDKVQVEPQLRPVVTPVASQPAPTTQPPRTTKAPPTSTPAPTTTPPTPTGTPTPTQTPTDPLPLPGQTGLPTPSRPRPGP